MNIRCMAVLGPHVVIACPRCNRANARTNGKRMSRSERHKPLPPVHTCFVPHPPIFSPRRNVPSTCFPARKLYRSLLLAFCGPMGRECATNQLTGTRAVRTTSRHQRRVVERRDAGGHSGAQYRRLLSYKYVLRSRSIDSCLVTASVPVYSPRRASSASAQ